MYSSIIQPVNNNMSRFARKALGGKKGSALTTNLNKIIVSNKQFEASAAKFQPTTHFMVTNDSKKRFRIDDLYASPEFCIC